jgi:hypothetical protein
VLTNDINYSSIVDDHFIAIGTTASTSTGTNEPSGSSGSSGERRAESGEGTCKRGRVD